MNLWCKKFPEKLNFVPATTKPTPLAFLNCISAKIKLKEIVPKRSDQVLVSAVAGIKQSVKDDERCQFRVFFFQPPVV